MVEIWVGVRGRKKNSSLSHYKSPGQKQTPKGETYFMNRQTDRH